MSKKSRRKIYKSRRPLAFESLEGRRVLAGNVTATLSGGALNLTGDAEGNQVFVQRQGGNSVVISALDGTTRINGQTSVTLSGSVRSITAAMGDGDDILHVAGKFRNRWSLSGGVDVTTGAGNDRVLLQHLQVAGGRTSIDTGAGNDTARISKSRHSSGVSINLGAGGDDGGVHGSRITGSIAVNGGDGSDRFVREGGKIPRGIDQTSVEGIVVPATQAPVLDLDGGTAGNNFTTTFAPGAGPQSIVSSTATLSDPDSTNLSSLTVTLTNRPDGASETLAATTTGTPITASFNNGVLSLTGTATVAQYLQVLKSVTYNNTATTPNSTARSVTFVASDGTNSSNTATATVNIAAAGAPVIDLDGGSAGTGFSATFTPGGGPQAVTANTATLTDSNSTNLTSLTATITNRPDGASEVLSATVNGTGITASFANGVLTLNGNATLAQYQQVLRTIRYNNTAATPNTAARTISFVASDGTNSSNTAITTLTIAAVGAPVLDLNGAAAGTGFSATFNPGGGPQAVVDASATLTDSNSTNLSSLTATITNRPDGASEVLAATTTGTPITANFTNGVLTLSGNATVAQYQQVLRTITYNNTAATPNTAARTINFVASDGTNSSATAATTLSIGSSGAPVLDLNGSATGTGFSTTFIPGGGPQAIVDSSATLTDSNSTNLSSLTVTITNRPDGASEVLAATTTGTPITASFNNGVLSLTGTATVAQYQQVLRTITYNNTAATPNTAARTVNFVASDGTNSSATAAATVNIGATGAPIIDLNANAAGTGFATTFTPGGGPQAVVGDNATITDSNSANLTSLTATLVNRPDGASEVLTATTSGTPIAASFSNGVLTLSGSATVAQYQQVLRTITYNNTAASPNTAARTINFVASDGANTGNTAVTTLSIGAAGAPVIDLDASAGGTGFSVNFVPGGGPVPVTANTAVISDSNSANLTSLTVTLTTRPNGASEVLAATTSGTPIAASFTNGVLTLSGAASVAQYQQVLRTITYNNTAASPNTENRQITFVASDGVNNSNQAITSLSINSSAPLVDLNGSDAGINFAVNFTAGGGAVAIADSDASITDSNSTNLASLTATLANRPDGAAEVLAATTVSGVTSSFNNGVLTLSGNATLAQYVQMLRSITYNNTAASPNTAQRNISVVVSDGVHTSSAATVNVSVTTPSGAPAIDLDGSAAGTGFSAGFTEGGSAVVIVDSDATLTDSNSTNLSSLTVTLTSPPDGASETLAANTTGTPISASFNGGVLTLSGAATVAQYLQVLKTVTYNNTSNNPSSTPRSITFVASDGALNSNTATATVSVTPVNDAPALDLDADNSSGQSGADFAASFTEGSGPVAVAGADATLSDTDSSTLSSMTVTITNLQNGASEVLAANANGTGINVAYVSATGTLNLTGAASVAAYQQVLRTITYNNTADNPGLTARSITFVANDGQANSNQGVTTLNVAATNDAPVLDLDADDSSGASGAGFNAAFTIGGGPVSIAGADATLVDVDSANLNMLTVSILNRQDGASEVLAADTSGTQITASFDADTGVLTLSGADTVANYQQVLRTVTYNNTAASPNTTSRTIRFVASDGVADSNLGQTTLSIS